MRQIVAEQQLRKRRLQSCFVSREKDEVDERMREATAEALNRSLTIEAELSIEPTHKNPRMEIVLPDKECEIVSAPLPKDTKKRNKNIKQRAKGKTNNKLVISTDKADNDGETISLLPCLEVETTQKIVELDNSIPVLDKLNNKNKGFDLTLNLLSDSEQVPNSYDSKENNTVVETKRVCNKSIDKRLVVEGRNNMNTSKSISTVSISAHDINESPVSKMAIGKSPTVIIRRLSQREMESHLQPSRDLVVFDSPSTSQSEVSLRKAQLNDSKSQRRRKSVISPILFDGDIMFKNRHLSSEAVPTSPLNKSALVQSQHRYDLRKFGKTLNSKDKSQCTNIPSILTQSDGQANVAVAKKQKVDSKNTTVSCKGQSFVTSVDERRNERRTRSKVVQTSPPNKSALEQSQHRYYKRKFGKTLNSKDKSQCTNIPSILTQSDGQANVGVAKKQKVDSKNTTVSCNVQPTAFSVDDRRNERRTRSKAVQTSPPNKSALEQSQHRYDLRKFGKTLNSKDKSQCTNIPSILTQSDGQANVGVAKKQKVDSKNTTVSCNVQPTAFSVDDRRNERRTRINNGTYKNHQSRRNSATETISKNPIDTSVEMLDEVQR